MARTRDEIVTELEAARVREEIAYAEAAGAEAAREDAWNLWVAKDLAATSATDEVDRLSAELDEIDGVESFDDSMDGDHASALASAGFGTDEDYEHNDIDSMDFDYDQPESFDYPDLEDYV